MKHYFKKTFILFFFPVMLLCPLSSAQNFSAQNYIIDTLNDEKIPFVVLDEVVVFPKLENKRYSRRNNPAVELLKNVLAHKQDNRFDTTGCNIQHYNKLTMYLQPFDFDLNRNAIRRKYKFLEQYVDTLLLPYQYVPYLPVSLRENLSRCDSGGHSIYAETYHAGVDKMLDQGTLKENIKALFDPIDVRDNNIDLMTVRFISPLSSTQANLFYRYFIVDTLQINDKECIDLAFVPVNPQMLSFQGHLYIVNDSSYAVHRCLMNVASEINLNWISNLQIRQDFKQMEDGKWNKATTVLESNFSLNRYMRHSIYARNQETIDKYDINDSQDSLLSVLRSRPIPLTRAEQQIDTMIEDLKRTPSFQRVVKTAKVLHEGYIPTSGDFTFENSYWDFGPILNTVSYNGIEGWRVRLGGMTTAKTHPNIFFDFYAAYGFRDKRPKGAATLTYSFNKKQHYASEQLRHALSLSGSYDLEVPGTRYGKITRDNILYSFDPHSWADASRWNTKAMYVARGIMKYEHQWENRMGLTTSFEYERVESAGSLDFNIFQTLNWDVSYSFSPRKPLYNSRSNAVGEMFQLSNKGPEFSINNRLGYLIEDNSIFNKTEMSVKYRLWMSQFGYIDMLYRAGILFQQSSSNSQLLFYPSANKSLLLTQHSFNMMQNMEFAMDKYVSWFLTYHMNGVILNRIPYINKLKLRGVVSFSGVYGSLSDKYQQAGINPISYTMPYMEMTAGIENIFRLFRIDYVRRLTYNDGLTGWQKNGIKISVSVNF